MKKVKYVLFLCIIAFSSLLFCACDSEYPSSAIEVGKGKDFETIQSAIDASTFAGQFIVIEPGEYKEDIVISKSIKLVGHFSRTVIKGSVTIESDGVKIENIVFNGENKSDNGIILLPEKEEMTGLLIRACDIKYYTQYGLYSPSSGGKTISGATFDRVDVIKNGTSGMYFENLKNSYFNDCYFELNGAKEEEKPHAGAIDFNWLFGEYGGIEMHLCDFRRNSNSKSFESSATTFRLSENAKYEGEVILDECYFLENSQDVISGSKEKGYKFVKISNINLQSWECDIKYFEG